MFSSARLKLTGWYLLIVMCISIAFSVAIYRVLTFELDRFSRMQSVRILQPRMMPMPDPELIEEIKQRLLVRLGVINAYIFVISGALAYFLAKKTLRPIQEMMDREYQFVSDASHELRTPLTSLRSALEVHLRDKKLTLTQAKQLMRDNMHDVDKLELLTNRLLVLSQYETILPITKTVALREVLNSAFKSLKQRIAQKKLTVKIAASPLTVQGDAAALVELFTIVLDNAVKYSPSGKTITVQVHKNNHMAHINVQDEGVGIAKTDIPHIFDRFYRADTARTKKETDGFGLGLSIAKRLVESHKGKIAVYSIPPTGTTITISLPLA